jgi:hypothetical protein
MKTIIHCVWFLPLCIDGRIGIQCHVIQIPGNKGSAAGGGGRTLHIRVNLKIKVPPGPPFVSIIHTCGCAVFKRLTTDRFNVADVC